MKIKAFRSFTVLAITALTLTLASRISIAAPDPVHKTKNDRLSKVTTFSVPTPAQSWQQLMQWEYFANGIAEDRAKDKATFVPQYFLIPKEEVLTYRPANMEKDAVAEKLVSAEKEGKEYVRWFINPEDTQYHLILADYLKEKGLDHQLHSYRESDPTNPAPGEELGHKSASRSSLLKIRPDNNDATTTTTTNNNNANEGSAIFYKTSTNFTGGRWKSTKKLQRTDVDDSMYASEISTRVSKRLKLGNLELAKEPLAMMIKEENIPVGKEKIDQGVVYRTFGDFPKNQTYLLPGFSAFHQTEGARLALLNSNDPDAKKPGVYWRKHYAGPVGKALANFIFTHHLTPTSIHSQQLLIELDKNYIPSGKIVMRDFNDSAAITPLWDKKNYAKFLQEWNEDKHDDLMLSFLLFHGSHRPTWIDSTEEKNWEKAYFDSFENELASLLDVKVDQLRKKDAFNHSDSISYFGRHWNLTAPIFRPWIAAQDCFKGYEKTPAGLSCDDVLDCFRGDNYYSRHHLACKDVMSALKEGKNIDPELEQKAKLEEIAPEAECHGNPYLTDSFFSLAIKARKILRSTDSYDSVFTDSDF
jgi:hypothetical protein